MRLDHLHDLLDPVDIYGDTDEDVWLPWVATAPHRDDDTLKDPAIFVLTGQRSPIIPLQDTMITDAEDILSALQHKEKLY